MTLCIARDRIGVVRRQQLAAGGPVDLHRVVAGRIVAGRDHDAAIALLVAHGERELRRAAVAVEEVDREAGRGHDLGAQLGEVAASGGACRRRWRRTSGLVRFGRLLLDVVGQALGAFADGAVVDGVAADRVHPPAASAGAEGDDGPEDVVQLLPFAGGQVLGHLGGIVGQVRLGQPGADVLHGRRAISSFFAAAVSSSFRAVEASNMVIGE